MNPIPIILAILLLPSALPSVALAGTPPHRFSEVRLVRCMDGDTCVFDITRADAVFGRLTMHGVRVRLLGVDTPEIHRARCEAERALGRKAKARLLALLRGARIELVATGRDGFGRVLARVLAGGKDVAAILIAEGLGVKSNGRRNKKGWC